jgi:hypothetical protein
MDKYGQTCITQQESFEKKFCKYRKSRIFIASQHFSMVLLWGQLHKKFLRFANRTRPSGRHGNFYQVARGQHPLLRLYALFRLLSPESLSCPKSIGSIAGGYPDILGSTIFKLFESRWVPGCTAAAGGIPLEFANP